MDVPNVEISINNYDVISSGLLIANETNDCAFNFDLTYPDFKFNIELKFTDDSSKSGNVIESSNNETTIYINCYNFKAALGEGLFKKAQIAVYKNKKIYFQFWTHIYGSKENTCRQIEYCLLIEKEAGPND